MYPGPGQSGWLYTGSGGGAMVMETNTPAKLDAGRISSRSAIIKTLSWNFDFRGKFVRIFLTRLLILRLAGLAFVIRIARTKQSFRQHAETNAWVYERSKKDLVVT